MWLGSDARPTGRSGTSELRSWLLEILEKPPGWGLDAIGDVDVVALVVIGSVALALFIIGLVTWLKGRKVVSVLVWLVFAGSAIWTLAPASWTESLLTAEPMEIANVVVAAVGGALLIGLLYAIRLAKPASWWAQRRYSSDKYDQAVERHGWSRPRAR